ncbi:MAG TPA: nucleotide exchange factor GrpE [Burkholderiaceae bacterium]|jgi:molecular chaperone GrpE|nr:nucleotide exchange factor GrpE [Burkholderiaceae bacterium]
MSDPQSETPHSPVPETGAPAEPSVDSPELDLAQRLAAAEAKAAEHFDMFVRARAEMDNVRKRAQEDVSKANKFAIESFAESLLPVRDSLEMALTVESPTMESLREGVTATLRQLVSALEKNRVIEINPVGEKFDPNRHQAISAVPAGSTQPPVPANHVVSVLQKGYLINDRVLRPALVSVAQG